MQRQIDKHIADTGSPAWQRGQRVSPSIPGARRRRLLYGRPSRRPRLRAVREGAFDITKELTLIAVSAASSPTTRWPVFGRRQRACGGGGRIGCSAPPRSSAAQLRQDLSRDGRNPQARAEWQLDPAKMLYAIYSTDSAQAATMRRRRPRKRQIVSAL